MNQAKVLVVEDNAVFAKILVQSLISLGYQVIGWVTLGKLAIDCVAQSAPDIILVDIFLKGEIDGFETIKLIQSQYEVPVICLSRSGNPAILKKAKTVSPWGYLITPFKEDDLRAVIEISMNKHHQTLQKSDQKRENDQSLDLLNQKQNEYLSLISHEFRSPLTSIQVATKILQENESRLPQEKKNDYFRQIEREIKNLDGIIEDFLVLSQAESGKLPVEPTALNLQEFCQKLLSSYKYIDHQKYKLILKVNCHQTQVYLDERRLRYILCNLLSNAIKYSPQGGEIRLQVETEGEYIRFIITDKGIGIPHEYQSKLFQRFERADNVGKIRGTGLGLSIVKQIVEELGGAIAMNSQLDEGTEVIVTLPINPSIQL